MIVKKIVNRIKLINKKYKLKNKKVIIHRSTLIDIFSEFEDYSKVGNNCIIKNSFIGRGTYLASDVSLFYSKVGRFCSIGPNVTCIIGNHPVKDFVSTHPAFFSLKNQAGFRFCNEQKFDDFIYVDDECKFMFEIGNDVWIGQDVRLMNGIKIGNGAIVAAGSLVVKNVPNYSIVAGVPAKIIKMRFSSRQIEKLELFQWWNKPFNWIKENSNQFTDIEEFNNFFLDED